MVSKQVHLGSIVLEMEEVARGSWEELLKWAAHRECEMAEKRETRFWEQLQNWWLIISSTWQKEENSTVGVGAQQSHDKNNSSTKKTLKYFIYILFDFLFVCLTAYTSQAEYNGSCCSCLEG